MTTLIEARKRLGLTQEDAAEKLEISRFTLINYENGITFPNIPILKRIEKIYGVEYKDIDFFPK